MRHITLAGIVVVLGQLAGGCGGVAERSSEPTPSTDPPPSTTGSVSGSMSLGDGAQHTQLSGVAYYEDFFVEGVAVSIVPWAGAHCGVGGGFAPHFDWLGLEGHHGQRFVTLSLSGDDKGQVQIWKVRDDENGQGYEGLDALDAKFEGIELPTQPGDTVSGHVSFVDPEEGYEANLTFSVMYCGSS